MGPTVKVRLVGSLREFDALAPVWREVTAQGGQTSPFLSHDWFACCWRTAGPNRHREVWVFDDAAGPVALVPLLRWTARVRGLPARVIGLMGCPETPFSDIPMAGRADEVMGTLLAALRARDDWEILALPKLPVESKTVTALERAVSGQLPWRLLKPECSPFVAVGESWETLAREQPPLHARWREIREGLARRGEVTVEEHCIVDSEGPLFGEVLEISRQSWNGPAGAGIATIQGMPRFFRELTRRASANGWLHLWILRLDGRAVATEYQIRADGWVHTLRTDHDEALADLSPATELSLRILRELIERPGVERYDLGQGPTAERLGLATGIREVAGFEIYAPTPQGRLLHWIETRLVPVLQRWHEHRGHADGSSAGAMRG